MLINEISKIGLGTWGLGGNVVAYPDNDDENDISAIQYALAHGINHIDTSESYSGGKSEILIGRAIKSFDRDQIIIATKVREWNLNYENLISSCYKSLTRLDTPYIDLYYVHKQNTDVTIQEICCGLNELLRRGLIKNVGLSNVGIDTINAYNHYLDVKVSAVQNQYNLVCRESQKKGVVQYCKQEKIPFISWRPLSLSFPDSSNLLYQSKMAAMIEPIAKKYDVSNIQIIAKWLLQQDNVYIIFKSNKIPHITEILDTQKFNLIQDDWEVLNRFFPIQFDTGCSINEFYELS